MEDYPDDVWTWDYKPCQRPGWIAPDGKWFPCGYFDHLEIARPLAKGFYNDLRGSICLEERGWMKVSGSGSLMIGWLEKEPLFITDDQVETVLRILDASSGEFADNLKQNLAWEVEHRGVERGDIVLPKLKVPGRGSQ